MKNKTCYIVGAGENYGLDFTTEVGDLVIAADGGLAYLQAQGITADITIGDFDSLAQKPMQPNVITLSSQKDDTDMSAAIREGIKRGHKTFQIYCGTGGRVEHTIANIQMLGYLSQNKMRGYLIDRNTIMTAVTNSSISFANSHRGYISIFSFSEKSTGVCLKGLKYKLEDAIMTNTYPIGVSNEFIGVESTVFVSEGTLIIVFPREHIKDISPCKLSTFRARLKDQTL